MIQMKKLSKLLILLFTVFAYGQTSHFVEIEGGRLHYKTIGSGTPILIINGGPGFNSEGFLPMATKIAEMGYQTILYDQRGTGKSTLETVSPETITLDLMNSDIEAIRKDMQLEEWIVLGHSFGGMMANYYAAHYPERVSAMIQSSSGGMNLDLMASARNGVTDKLTTKEADSLIYWQQRYARTQDTKDRRRYVRYMAKAYVHNDSHATAVADRLMEGNLQLNRMVWNDLQEIAFDCSEALKSFTKPVLILYGKNDVVPVEIATGMANIYPNATLVPMENCGHYGWLDNPKTYYGSIKTFISSLN
ncbi:alpha/beta fold hydrolase [Luteirhabdus pelagi]|uniref:alpha/beta fold hydrolase n=1 Tax=Luteirhabdus pelagi TaxID=2792783 RepID=UPI0019397AD0|nr:alpha/beta hydrolase [Luteirhabdus pelagi]